MRLTLRTLLAYLDDTLEPAQARLIGQKVSESEAAQELIARIKQVTRRRRLTTPPATGPGARLDPNTIAEYLDNELAVEEVATVEETCLGSDVHLAEVAACHQILTLVLGEPAMVPPFARQRMYGLIQGREAIPYRKPPAVPSPSAAERASASDDEGDDALQLGLPLHRLGNAWLIPAAAVVLLLASAAALWMALRTGETPPVIVAQTQPAEPEPLPSPKLETEEAPPPTPVVPPEGKPAVKPEPDKKPVVEIKPEVKPQMDPTAPAPPSDKHVKAGRYVFADGWPGLLLRATREDAAPWQRLAPEGPVQTGDYLVSLPGYRSELRLDRGVRLQLWGNLPEFSPIPVVESAVTLHENAAFDLDLTLERGRIVFVNHKAEGPAQVRLRFLKEIWDVTLQEPGSVAAAELFSAYDQGIPFSKEPGGEKPTAQLALLVLEGEAGIKARPRQFGGLKAPALFRWDSERGSGDRPFPLPRVPDWWTDKGSSARPFAKEMRKALGELANRVTPPVSLDVALTEARRSTDPASRVLALRFHGALDDLPSLLDALADEEHDDVRFTAIDVLRTWSGLRADHDLRLFRTVMSRGVPETHAEIIMQLLHTFSQEQVASPATYETLIEYLRHDRLPIRELAYFHLRFLAPEGAKKIAYRPAGPAEQRELAYEQWKKYIPTGKLPPRAQSGPGNPGG